MRNFTAHDWIQEAAGMGDVAQEWYRTFERDGGHNHSPGEIFTYHGRRCRWVRNTYPDAGERDYMLELLPEEDKP